MHYKENKIRFFRIKAKGIDSTGMCCEFPDVLLLYYLGDHHYFAATNNNLELSSFYRNCVSFYCFDY